MTKASRRSRHNHAAQDAARRPLPALRVRLARWAFALCLFLAPASALAAWSPPGWEESEARREEGSTDPATLVLGWAVRAYQKTVSRVDGDRCPSYPSCSAYALEAVRRHGALLGALLTAGRLVGEADEAAFAPRILVDGRWRVYAPVEDDLAFLRGRLDP